MTQRKPLTKGETMNELKQTYEGWIREVFEILKKRGMRTRDQFYAVKNSPRHAQEDFQSGMKAMDFASKV